MTDTARAVAHNPNAPADERFDAQSELQKAAMPSSSDVANVTPMVEYVAELWREQSMQKAMRHGDMVPFPSDRAQSGQPGMQSVWIDDRRINIQGDWYERPTSFSFDMMRTMVAQTPVLSAVILTRIRQVKRFCRPSLDGKGPGFQIRPRDGSKVSAGRQRELDTLRDFFVNSGFERDPRQRSRLRRDNFSNLMSKLVRDSLTMDSAPIETEFKRNRSLGLDGLYAVDGATIRLCTESGYQGQDEIYALQVIEGQVSSAYTFDDLIYVPRNPSTDITTGGYGMSETEWLIRVVTGFLNAFTYNTSYFDKNAIPRGVLHMSGSYTNEDIAAFKRYWNSMVRGVDNSWSLPVMVSKDQESKASFEQLGEGVQDAMFERWMTFLAAIICAIYGIAPEEINFDSFSTRAGGLSGNDTEEKLVNSKDKGLRPLLSHFSDTFTDYVVSTFDPDLEFVWTGLDEKDDKQQWEEEKTLATVNEARAARGQERIDGAWGDAPLNPVLVPLWQAENQANSEDYGSPDDDEGPGDGQPPGPGQDDDGQDGGAAGEEDEGGNGQPPGNPMAKSFADGLPFLRLEV